MIAMLAIVLLLAGWTSPPSNVRVLGVVLSLMVLVGAGAVRRRQNQAAIARARSYVEFDEREVRFTERGESQTLPWRALTGIDVITTSGGPWANDVFLVLLVEPGDSIGCIVPQESEGFQPLANHVLTLPAFDVDEFVAAMGSTRDHRFRCWRRGAVDSV
ncbi:MAG: hypothetical protein ABI601_10340 [bacterium]